MSVFPVFKGNCPRRVSRDAKYSIRTGFGSNRGPVVALTYEAEEDERWYATTDEHPELVNMVNQVKQSLGLPPNGSFYINEYKQVIVPTTASDDYYLAGKYNMPLRFDFDGKILSGEPFDFQGNPLSPGDTWSGPHPGIPYVLAAGGNDITYKYSRSVTGGKIEKKVKLSKMIGAEKAASVANAVRGLKGFNGGRFFVNEFGAIFAPIQEGSEWRYVYIGQIDFSEWYPEPHTGEDANY